MEAKRKRQIASENETRAINLSQHPISFQLRIYCEKIKTIYSCWKSFRCKFFPVPSLSMACNSRSVLLQCVCCTCTFCVFLRECKSVLIAVVMVDVATRNHLRRHRRRYCLNTDFRFKDAYSCLEIYSEPLTFLLVLSHSSYISCRNVFFSISILVLVGRWSCCVCLAVLLIIFICCPFIQCNRVRCNVLPSRRSALAWYSIFFLSFHPLYTKFPFCSLTFPVFISFRFILLLTN